MLGMGLKLVEFGRELRSWLTFCERMQRVSKSDAGLGLTDVSLDGQYFWQCSPKVAYEVLDTKKVNQNFIQLIKKEQA